MTNRSTALITGGGGNLATMICRNLSLYFEEMYRPLRTELDLLDAEQVDTFFRTHGPFTIVFHTAVRGGRRTRPDTAQDVYENLLMLENLLRHYESGFDRLLHFDSAAIYDRRTDIDCRREDELWSVPTDYYGFSKYSVFQRTRHLSKIFHLRVFNIFHEHEEHDRFIKTCFRHRSERTPVRIDRDRYFDFVSEHDFMTVLKTLYLNHNVTPKVINLVYTEKYKLSDIARLIGCETEIVSASEHHHYCGDGSLLASLVPHLEGLERSLEKMAGCADSDFSVFRTKC